MIPITILVGVGGQGTAIAERVRQRLLDFADERTNAAAERLAVQNSVSIFAVDTLKQDGLHTNIPAQNLFVLNPPAAGVAVRTLRNASQDTFFREWWPQHIQTPGDFLQGAGAMRAKGRLAYYLTSGRTAAGGPTISEAVASELTRLAAVRVQAGAGGMGGPNSYVIIVGSLSGGTGSGMMTTLAMDIRNHVTNSNGVRIVGAIPLASVMEMGPARYMKENLYANCSAGLREIEWWMTDEEFRTKDIAPFFQMGGMSTPANIVPFDACYIFTRRNRTGLALDTFEDYTNLIGDCLALDVNSPISAQAQAMISNVVQQALPATRPPQNAVCKPVIFASAGASSLEYPVQSITRYLGYQFLGTVLDEYVLRPVAGSGAPAWMEQMKLTVPDVHAALTAPYFNAQTHITKQVGAKPALEQKLAEAGRSEIGQEIHRARVSFDDSWITILEKELLPLNKAKLTGEYRAMIWAEIGARLQIPDGTGFPQAARFAADVRANISANWAIVNDEIELNSNEARATQPGRRERLKALSDGYDKQLKDLFGVTNRGMVLGRARAVEAVSGDFVKKWWKPYTENREWIIVGEAHREVLNNLTTWLDIVLAQIAQIYADLTKTRVQLGTDASNQIGTSANAMLVLEERVLDHPKLVDALFKKTLDAATMPGAQAATSVATRITAGNDGIATLLTRLDADPPVTPQQQGTRIQYAILSISEAERRSASGRFYDDVARLSIWDALTEEALMRRNDPEMQDQHMQRILDGNKGLDNAALVTQYVTRRVEQCIKSATSFWQLENTKILQYSGTFMVNKDGLVSYSDAPFKDANDVLRQGLHATIKGLALQEGIRAEPANESIHRIIATTREIGAPLFMLNSAELSDLQRNEEQWVSRNKHVYIDQRYADALPADLSLETVEMQVAEKLRREEEARRREEERIQQEAAKAAKDFREARALLYGFHFNYLQFAPNGTGPDRRVVEFNEDAESPDWNALSEKGLLGALQKVKGDPDVLSDIQRLIDNSWRSIAPAERERQRRTARDWARAERTWAQQNPELTIAAPHLEAALELLDAIQADQAANV